MKRFNPFWVPVITCLLFNLFGSTKHREYFGILLSIFTVGLVLFSEINKQSKNR